MRLTALIILLTVSLHSQNRKADSLFRVLKTPKEDTNRVNRLNALAWELMYANPDTSILLSTQALLLAEKLSFQVGIGKANHEIGWFNYIKGNYTKAFEYNFKALAIWEKAEKETSTTYSTHDILHFKSKTLANLGSIYLTQAKYPKALEYYFRAEKIFEARKSKDDIAITLSSIGAVYYSQTNYPKAIDYYSQALKLFKELGNKNYIAMQLGNMGIVYYELSYYSRSRKSEHDSLLALSLAYYSQALKTDVELGNKTAAASVLDNMGNIYAEQAEVKTDKTESDLLFDKALDHHFKSLKMCEELEDANGIAISLGHIGTLYVKTKKFKEAEKYLTKSLTLYYSIGDLGGISGFEKIYSLLDSSRGNYLGSLEHYKKYIAARDSILNGENIKKQTEQEMQYTFDKQQVADSIKNAEQIKHQNQIHDQEIKEQRTYTYGGIIGFILMIIVAGVSFRAYKQKQKANEVISLQKKMVEEKQKEILDSIRYAKRIQQSLLPSAKYIERKLKR